MGGGGEPLGPALNPLMDHAPLWLNIETLSTG